jgi:hypothetical protein
MMFLLHYDYLHNQLLGKHESNDFFSLSTVQLSSNLSNNICTFEVGFWGS